MDNEKGEDKTGKIYPFLPEPVKVAAQDWPKEVPPLVSISCITFNHEAFIRDTLEGFLSQETSFRVEVLIHDDASTDATAKIIREYEAKYPGLFRPIYQDENQYSKGISGISGIFNFSRATGRYIAICEGDDYWTDPSKLQRQVTFLEQHDDYSLVAENAKIYNSIKDTVYDFNPANLEKDIHTQELLENRKFPTASVLFRTHLVEGYLKLKQGGDTILWVYLSTKGNIRFLPHFSSVYRRGMHGVVESTHKVKWAQRMESWNEVIAEVLPPDFDKGILKERNFSEYQHAFLIAFRTKNYQDALFCLKKCFYFRPLASSKMLLKAGLKKIG